MSAMPPRSYAFQPAPSSGESGIMPDLYRLQIGPINAPYYQQQFQRFESSGKVTLTWNHGAAFFTLGWLLLRKLWRPAGIYAAVLLATWALWWWGLHGRVPLAAETALCGLAALLLCALPGFMGNGLYYRQVRQHTLQTLTSASSLGQARQRLADGAPSKERLQVIAALHALGALALAGVLMWHSDDPATSGAPQATAPAGPPDLVIPAVASIASLSLETLATSPATAPDAELPLTKPEVPSTSSVIAAASEPTATAASTPPSADALSVAQSLPAPVASAPTHDLEAAPVPAAPAPLPKPVAAATPATPLSVTPHKVATAPTPPQAQRKPQAQAPSPVAASSKSAPGKYYLHAGVYAQTANANAVVKKLQAAKLPTSRQTVAGKNGELTRVRIGPFQTRKQAEQAAAQAKKMRIDTAIHQQARP